MGDTISSLIKEGFMNKKIVVLGAGISGLSAAYALRSKYDVLVLEKDKRPGGWFEKSARTFRSSSCPELLSLCQELGIENEILECAPEAKKRYLYFRGKLEEVPSNPFDFFRSPLLKGVRWSLLNEWRRPAFDGDETLFQFAERRFGKEMALRFFDAFSIGVFATSSKNISIEQAFPFLKEMERTYGSLTKALFARIKQKKRSQKRATLFSFRGGTKTLVDALVENLKNQLRCQEEVLAVRKKEDGYEVISNKASYEADVVIAALPPKTTGKMLHLEDLQNLEMTSLCMVKLHYEDDLLPLKGFGYLVPSIEQKPLLGVVFDSCIFPSENRGMQTRLTAMMPMMKNSKENAISLIRDHLKIVDRPSLLEETICNEAIFLPKMGHRERIKRVLESLPQNLILAGNYLEGVSVNDCIRSGFNAAKKVQDVL
jgi:oxygen-dependent protoporphyrinogen oxidase